jgi:hypothetical protein
MKTLSAAALALVVTAAPAAAAPPPASLPGYVDGAPFKELLDESQDIVEVNLDGAILQALAKSGSKDHDAEGDRDDENAKDLFGKLKSIHAVIGTVKGPADAAFDLVRRTEKRLSGSGWQRVTHIADATSTVSVLTHVVDDRIDGLVALIFDREDRELVFANLAGEVDMTKLGAIGERFDVPGLAQVPGGR